MQDLGWNRSELVVTCKVFFGAGGAQLNARGLSRKHVVEGLRVCADCVLPDRACNFLSRLGIV